MFKRFSSSLTKHVPSSIAYEAEVVNGTPAEILKRKVRIYIPVESTMQSGQSGKQWKMDWDVVDRWSNPVMGWASSADPMQALSIKFQTKDQAILFAERNGYDWTVQEPKQEKWTKKTYADNYTVFLDINANCSLSLDT